MSKNYEVWLKYGERAAAADDEPAGVWIKQGDGPMGPRTAERIAREIKEDFAGVQTTVRPFGETPV